MSRCPRESSTSMTRAFRHTSSIESPSTYRRPARIRAPSVLSSRAASSGHGPNTISSGRSYRDSPVV